MSFNAICVCFERLHGLFPVIGSAHIRRLTFGRVVVNLINKILTMKKRPEATQTLRAGCSKAEPKIFAPPQTPFPGAQDGQSAGDGHYLHLQTQFGEDRCMQF